MDTQIKEMLEGLVSQMHVQLKAEGIGKGCIFNAVGTTKIELAPEISGLLTYSDLAFYVSRTQYFIVKEENLIYQGLLDSEGAYETVVNDLKETPDFINLMLVSAMEDADKLNELFSDDDLLTKAYVQMFAGMSKGIKNDHY